MIISQYRKKKRLLYVFLSATLVYIAIAICNVIFFTHIPKKPNIQVLLSNADFEYSNSSQKDGSDFISYSVDNYFLSTTEKTVRLKSVKAEKITDDITMFVLPTLIRFVNEDLCNFDSENAIYNSETSYLEIKKPAKMKCFSGNNGISNELFGYTNIGSFYGNKGVDLYQDGMRIVADTFVLTDNGDIIDLVGHVAVYFYSDQSFSKVTTTIFSDKLRYEKKDEIVYLYDNVRIINSSGIIEGQYSECYLTKVNGKMDLDYMIINTKVKYENGKDNNIFADEMRYYKASGIVDAEGNVIMKNENATSKAPYFAYDINADVGRFITEYEYHVLKKQYTVFTLDIAKYVIYSNRVGIQNKAVRVSGDIPLEEDISEKNISKKSKIRIKGGNME